MTLPPITVVRDGEPARPLELARELIAAARALVERTGSCPDSLLESVDRLLELELGPAFARLPAGWRP